MSESYYNRQIVLHVEEFVLGEWYAVQESERGSVEAAIKVAHARTARQWRIVDAGGNVHEQSIPVVLGSYAEAVRKQAEDRGARFANAVRAQNKIARRVAARPGAVIELGDIIDYAQAEESTHIRVSERRRLLEAALREDGFATTEELLERRA